MPWYDSVRMRHKSVRVAAAGALAGRDIDEVTQALLDCLANDDEHLVRAEAAWVLTSSPSPKALLTAAAQDYHRLSFPLPEMVVISEWLTARDDLYRPPCRR